MVVVIAFVAVGFRASLSTVLVTEPILGVLLLENLMPTMYDHSSALGYAVRAKCCSCPLNESGLPSRFDCELFRVGVAASTVL